MPISFPVSAVDGQIHTMGGIVYFYDAADDKWIAQSSVPTGDANTSLPDVYIGTMEFDATTGDIKSVRNDLFETSTSLDGRYLPLSGGTLTGPLVVDSALTVTGNTTVTNVSATGTIDTVDLTVSNAATVETLVSNNATVETLTSNNATVETLVANSITSQSLVSNTAVFETLLSNTANFSTMVSNNATVETLTSNNATVETLTANSSTVETLVANNATVETFTANNGTVETLTSNNTTIETLVANNTTTETLVANNTTTETFTANNGTVETLTANTLTVEGTTTFSNTVVFNSNTIFNGTLTANAVDIAMGDLTDADTTGVMTGQYMAWNGTEFVPTTPTSGADTYVAASAFDANTRVLTLTMSDASTLTSTIPLQAIPAETVTAMSIAGNVLTYTDEAGANTAIDLSLYIDDTNLARLTAGSVAANGMATFTRDDATTFDVDFASIVGQNDTYPVSAAIDPAGVITTTLNDGNTYTVDISNWVYAQTLDQHSDVDTTTSAPADGEILAWDATAVKWVPTTLPASPGETVTSLSLASNILTYTDEAGANTAIDLSIYIDDTNLARLIAGSVAANGTATFTRDDSTTFDVDFSALFDDTNLARITSGSVVGNNITMVRDDSTTFDIDVSSIVGSADTYPASASIDPAGIITTTLNDGNTYTVDISPWVYAQTLNQHSDVDTLTTLPADGEVLTWDATAVSWVPAALPAGTVDTVITGLTFDGNTNTLSAGVSDGGTYSVVIPSSNVTSLGSLSNVDSEVDDQPSNREFLTWSPLANSFVLDASSLAWIGDVNTTGLANGQVLQWDENSGFSGEWVPTTLPAGTVDTVINALTFDSNTNVLTAGVSDGNTFSVTLPAGGGLSSVTDVTYTVPYPSSSPYASYEVPSSYLSNYAIGYAGVTTNATQSTNTGMNIGQLMPSLRYNFVGISGGEAVTLTSDIAAEIAATSGSATSGFTDFIVEIRNESGAGGPYGAVEFNSNEFTIINNGGVFPDMSVVDKHFYFRIYQTPVAGIEGKFNVEFLGDSEGGTATGGTSTGATVLNDLGDVINADFWKQSQPTNINKKYQGVVLGAVPVANTYAPQWGNEIPSALILYSANGTIFYADSTAISPVTSELTFYEGRTMVIEYQYDGSDPLANSAISWALSETEDGTHNGGTKYTHPSVTYFAGSDVLQENGIRMQVVPDWPDTMYLYDENNAGRGTKINILKGAHAAGGGGLNSVTELSYTQPYNPTGPYSTYDVPSAVFSTYSQGNAGIVTNTTQQTNTGVPIGTLEPSIRYNFVGISGGENVTLTSDIAAEFAASLGFTDFLVEIQNNASSAPYGSVQFNPAEFTIINNGGVFPDMSVVDKNFYFRIYQTPVAELEGKFNVEFLGDSEGGTATGGASIPDGTAAFQQLSWNGTDWVATTPYASSIIMANSDAAGDSMLSSTAGSFGGQGAGIYYNFTDDKLKYKDIGTDQWLTVATTDDVTSLADGTEYGQLLWWNNADWRTSAGISTGFEFDGWTGRITTPQITYLYNSANDKSGPFVTVSLLEQFNKVDAAIDTLISLADVHASTIRRTLVEIHISAGATVTISSQVKIDGILGGTITGDGVHILEIVTRGSEASGVHWRNQKFKDTSSWTLLGQTTVDSSSMTVSPYANIGALFADATEGMIVARHGTEYVSSCIPADAVDSFPASFGLHKGGSLSGEVIFTSGVSTLYQIAMGAADEIKIYYR